MRHWTRAALLFYYIITCGFFYSRPELSLPLFSECLTIDKFERLFYRIVNMGLTAILSCHPIMCTHVPIVNIGLVENSESTMLRV